MIFAIASFIGLEEYSVSPKIGASEICGAGTTSDMANVLLR